MGWAFIFLDFTPRLRYCVSYFFILILLRSREIPDKTMFLCKQQADEI
jgi:hypothetical protein